MEKTIDIGGRTVRLNNSIGWAMIYREQFGTDVVATMIPLLVGGADLIMALLAEAGVKPDGKEVSVDPAQLADAIGSDAYYAALAQLSDIKLTDVTDITWAMAKNADSSVADPKQWIRQFDSFPVDVVVPEIYGLMAKGFISSKNLQRLQKLLKGLRPSLSTTSSSPESSEV